ncbi:MAG: FAD-dependent oxidoreductase [Deltaproteobacteria bacterium]|nr:FAD-dependent oxidoreductase [Deltaproteobacteria bacterium]
MAEPYRYLFNPIDIGPVHVKNRFYLSSHYTVYVDRDTGLPNDQMAPYYEERAKSGVGLLCQSVADIHPTVEYAPVPTMRLYDRRALPLLKDITTRVHRHGAKMFIQLWHTGQASSCFDTGHPAIAPSPVPNASTIPKEMTGAEIEEMIQAFADGAAVAEEAGYDGIVLHGTHGYLIENFLSPFFNKRGDEYGGSLDNRMRFLVQVIERVRGVIGKRLALGLRLVGEELLPGGLGVEETTTIAQRLEAAGQLDFLDVDVGSYHNYHIGIGPMYVAPHYNLLAAAPIKAALEKLPLLCTPGRLATPQEAERVLADGQADMVGVARALIADPEWLLKAQQGRAEDIRACTYTNQYCLGRLFRGRPIGCIQNPATGREREWGVGTLTRATTKKRVMVVGGGPSGLEAARVAALRGHTVALYEKADELGGQVNLAAKLPGRDEIAEVTGWLSRQIAKSDVEIHLGCEVTPELVEKTAPDVLVIATGAEFSRSGFSGVVPEALPGWNQPHVLTPEQVLRAEKRPGQTVLVVDEEYNQVAPGLAELLARQGKKVTLVTSQPSIGRDLLVTMALPHVLARLAESGVEIIPGHYVKTIAGASVELFNVCAPQLETRLAGIETVVLVATRETRDGLSAQAKGKVEEVHVIGDCVTPRDIGAAIFEGHRLGRSL